MQCHKWPVGVGSKKLSSQIHPRVHWDIYKLGVIRCFSQDWSDLCPRSITPQITPSDYLSGGSSAAYDVPLIALPLAAPWCPAVWMPLRASQQCLFIPPLLALGLFWFVKHVKINVSGNDLMSQYHSILYELQIWWHKYFHKYLCGEKKVRHGQEQCGQSYKHQLQDLAWLWSW